MITMGLIPSIKSDQVTTTVAGMKNSPQENMKELAAMQGASDSSVATMSGEAAKGQQGRGDEAGLHQGLGERRSEVVKEPTRSST